jgi:hypothetical protein
MTMLGLVNDLFNPQAVYAVAEGGFDHLARRRPQELQAQRLQHGNQAGRWNGVAWEDYPERRLLAPAMSCSSASSCGPMRRNSSR